MHPHTVAAQRGLQKTQQQPHNTTTSSVHSDQTMRCRKEGTTQMILQHLLLPLQLRLHEGCCAVGRLVLSAKPPPRVDSCTQCVKLLLLRRRRRCLTSDRSCDRCSPALAILLAWLHLRQQHAWQAGQCVCVHTGCQHMCHLRSQNAKKANVVCQRY